MVIFMNLKDLRRSKIEVRNHRFISEYTLNRIQFFCQYFMNLPRARDSTNPHEYPPLHTQHHSISWLSKILLHRIYILSSTLTGFASLFLVSASRPPLLFAPWHLNLARCDGVGLSYIKYVPKSYAFVITQEPDAMHFASIAMY